MIAEAQIESRNTSGYNTTILPLSYGKSVDRILCDYSEDYIRVGSMVYIEVRWSAHTHTHTCTATVHRVLTELGWVELGPAVLLSASLHRCPIHGFLLLSHQ